MDNKEFPSGWGDNAEDDDDYGFDNDIDDDDENSAWGSGNSPFKESKHLAAQNSDNQPEIQSNYPADNSDNKSNPDQANNTLNQDNVQNQKNVSPPAPQSSSTGYVIQKRKTNPTLIIAVIVMVIVIVILCVAIFIVSRNSKKNSDPTSSISENEATTANEEVTTEAEISTTITSTVTTDIIATETTTKTNEYSPDEISALFSAYISENPDPSRTYDNSDYGYALIDLNDDGNQELLITTGEVESGSPGVIEVYAIKDGKLTQLWKSDPRFVGTLCENNIIYCTFTSGSGNGTAFYKYSYGDSLDNFDSVYHDYSSGSEKIYYNSSEITENEANDIMEKYKPIQLEVLPLIVDIRIETETISGTDTLDAAKKVMYTHLDEEFYKEKTEKYHFFDRDAKYALYDINADGIEELFISYANSVSIGSDLYIYKNGIYVKKHHFAEGAKICLTEHLICENIYGGGEMTKIYVISDNDILQKDEISKLYNSEFYHNDLSVSESEYNKLKSKYDFLDWIYIPDNSHDFSELIDMTAYAGNNNSDKYTKYDTSQAPTDMYLIPESEGGVRAIVATESDALNLRTGASTASDVIVRMPKGSVVLLYGANTEWCYLCYNDNGTQYYGYARAQYIEIS